MERQNTRLPLFAHRCWADRNVWRFQWFLAHILIRIYCTRLVNYPRHTYLDSNHSGCLLENIILLPPMKSSAFNFFLIFPLPPKFRLDVEYSWMLFFCINVIPLRILAIQIKYIILCLWFGIPCSVFFWFVQFFFSSLFSEFAMNISHSSLCAFWNAKTQRTTRKRKPFGWNLSKSNARGVFNNRISN